MCEWTCTHRHIHSQKYKTLPKIIEGRIMFWEDVNPRDKLPDVSFILKILGSRY